MNYGFFLIFTHFATLQVTNIIAKTKNKKIQNEKQKFNSPKSQNEK